MDKFKTTNPILFNNNNDSVMPDWMQSLGDNLQYKENKKLVIDFDNKGAFAAGSTVNRPELDATAREVIANLNNDRIELDSKVELAKFLIGKYYKTKVRMDNDIVYMDTTIDGLQANFIFEYNYKNGKVSQANSFMVNESEYPFSKAGFEESLRDLKTGSLKKSTMKVASSRETFVINREEIIRRYNGHLREATEVINKNVSQGILIGVGSNAYATYYDPNELFPQMQKEVPQLPTGSFEFVNNTEHVSTNEHKSAKKLSFEASKIMSNLFSDYIINNTKRDNDELLINATVLNGKTGIRNNVNFNFSIENEKVASLRLAEMNNERMSTKQLLDKLNVKNNLVDDYLKSSIASKRIHEGIILTEREIKDKLTPIVGQNKTKDFINSWLKLNAISQLNNTTYVSNNTMEELLSMISAETLTTEEKTKMANYKKSFGSGLDFDRIDQNDTGIRDSDDAELTSELKLGKINSELSRHFKNYQIIEFNNDTIRAQFTNNGVRHSIKLIAKFNYRKLEKISAIVNNKEVELNNLVKAFNVSSLLNSYLQTEAANNFSTSIIASGNNILERLSKITPDAESIFTNWKSNYLKNIGSNIYSSKYSFEELLNKTTANLLSDEDKQQIMIAKKHFGTSLQRIAETDTGIRDMESKVSNETLLYEANKLLSQHFANYSPKYFETIIENNSNNTSQYKIALFDENTGLSTDVDFVLSFEGNIPKSCNALINGEHVSINNVKKAFAMNEALSRYLQSNSNKKFNAPMVITKGDLFRRLNSIANIDNNEIEKIISSWQKYGKVHQLNENTYASKSSLEQLISMSNIKPLSDNEIAIKLDKCRRDKGFGLTANYLNDNDTRRPEEVWTGEKMALHGRTVICGMFADFDIINAELEKDDFLITARIINPISGLKKSLKFKFNTLNGTKLGELESINDGNKTVDVNNILELLESNDEAVNKFISLNDVSNRNHKNIISKSNLKSKLAMLIDSTQQSNIINHLTTAGILNQIDGFNYASEYSFPDIIEYLSNNNKLDLKTADNNIKTYCKDNVVNTDVPVIMETDSRQLDKPIETLNPKMIDTSNKLRKIISTANNNKKITVNKTNQLIGMLDISKNPNDIENVWRELKKYL